MNRKLVLLPLTVMLTVLIAPIFVIPASASVPPDLSPPFSVDIARLTSISGPERIWESNTKAGKTIYMRGIQVTGFYVLSDSEDNELHGLAALRIDSDINVKRSQAHTHISILLTDEYGRWEGDMSLTTRWIAGDNMGAGYGTCTLRGYGAWIGFVITLRLSMDKTGVDMAGMMWDPHAHAWYPIV